MSFKMDFTDEGDWIHFIGVLDARRGSVSWNTQDLPEISLRMSEEDKFYIENLHKLFGGTLFPNEDSWWWKAYGLDASRILNKLLPIAKKIRALKLSTYQEVLKKWLATEKDKSDLLLSEDARAWSSKTQLWIFKTLKEAGVEGLKSEHRLKGHRYYADIAIPSEKLAIEIDGLFWHNAKADRVRDIAFEKAGWTVKRFPAEKDSVQTILRYLKKRAKQRSVKKVS